MINPLHSWFMYLFDQRKDKEGFVQCFECGRRMHENTWKNLSTCYSHILSKKDYPEYKGDENNVKIVHPDCHNLYTMTPKKAKNQYFEYLKLKEEHENKCID